MQDGTPLRFNLWGVNLFTEGHFDLYVADYLSYKVSGLMSLPRVAKSLASSMMRHML